MRNNLSPLIFIICFIVSCKHKTLIPGFAIGMSENELKSGIKSAIVGKNLQLKNLNDSSTFKYQWKINGQTLSTRLALNSDGVNKGNLRICVLDISDSAVSKNFNQPYSVVKKNIRQHEEIFAIEVNASKTFVNYSTCPTERFESVLKGLRNLYGKEDSITYRIISYLTDIDTAYYFYHWHDSKSQIVLRREKIFSPSTLISFSHINSVIIYELGENYEQDLKQIIEKEKAQLKPMDVVFVPVSYKIKEDTNKWGRNNIYIDISIYLNPELRISVIENRGITSISGTINIYDHFHRLLYSISNVELNTASSLPAVKGAGLKLALGETAPLITTTQSYSARLQVNHPKIPELLYNAILNQSEIKIEYLPEILLFDDGTVLK